MHSLHLPYVSTVLQLDILLHRVCDRQSARSAGASTPIPTKPFTPEQQTEAKAVSACKTHYDVLGITRNAEEADVKKAYRKVLMHADPC